MSSSKRDFTNFREFPGEINEGTGYHEFPTLWHMDSANRWREWHIYIRLVKHGDALTGIDWDLLKEKQVPIHDSYYDMEEKIPLNIKAQLWVETGITGGKSTRSAPTYITDPVNEGKSNERNVFQHALTIARSQWLKRKEKGGSEKKKEKKASSNVNVMYFPMLAKSYKDGEKHIVYPAYIQSKLDGVRCLMFLQKKNDPKSVVAYTRSKKPLPSVDYVKEILYPYLNDLYDEENNQSIYFDGELYKHGKKLQDISGDSRNEKTNTSKTNTGRNEYHIFDCFYPKELDNTFESRHEQLVNFYNALSEEDAKTIRSVPTYKVNNEREANKQYEKFKKMGYEGAMLRNIEGVYAADPNKSSSKLRSPDLVKMKPTFTDEFEVIGYTQGSKGKDKGAVIWVCQTKDEKEFNATPKDITYEERYELFNECEESFDKVYANRMMTIEYQDLSADGIPLRAKAVGFRDYE